MPPSGTSRARAIRETSMSVGYEVGSSVTVRALHQMPVAGPEGELHPHDYRIDVVVGRRELDEHGMVCDLDALRAAGGDTLAVRVWESASDFGGYAGPVA